MGGKAARRARRVAPRGEHQVLVADPAGGGKQRIFGEVNAGYLGFKKAAAALAEWGDGGADAVGVDPPHGHLVDQGYERVFL
jgi:hypothetical protein